MSEEVRTVRVEEFCDFMRFLERCYGHSRDFFLRAYPHLYRPDPEACACCHVVAREGRIVSHVGLFPIEVVVAGVRLPLGGIGGVATLPEERGKGHMSRLLRHAIELMRRSGCLVSGLGGDRQRYNAFGWEWAGLAVHLTFSRRSVDRAQVEPVEIQEVRPDEALDAVAGFHMLQPCHVRRPKLALQLRMQGVRLWVAQDGYVLASGESPAPPTILELVSGSGREAGMVRALLDASRAGEVHWHRFSAWDHERLARLLPCVSSWTTGSDWSYRINDLPGLLVACRPVLEQRAACLRDFDVSLGIREHDRVDEATIALRNGDLELSSGRSSHTYVELDPVAAVRLFLGGPSAPAGCGVPQALHALLPLPVHVPPLDHV